MKRRIVSLIFALIFAFAFVSVVANAGTYKNINNVAVSDDWSVSFDKVADAAKYDIWVKDTKGGTSKIVGFTESNGKILMNGTEVKAAFSNRIAQAALTGEKELSFTIFAYKQDGTKLAQSEATKLLVDTTSGNISGKVEIVNYKKKLDTKCYRPTLTFNAKIDAVDGMSVVWYNGNDEIGRGETITLEEVRASMNVRAVLINSQNVAVAETETEEVAIKTGIFAKIIAFFKGIFHRLPKFVDNIKK